MDLSLGNLGAEDTLPKLVSFSQDVSVSVTLFFIFYISPPLMSFLFQVSNNVSPYMKIQAERVELALKE